MIKYLLFLFSINCFAQTNQQTINLLNGTFIKNSQSGKAWPNYIVIGYDLIKTEYPIISDENNPVIINGVTILTSGYQNQPPDLVFPPGNIFDNDLTTKWAAKGLGHWVQFTLTEVRVLESIDVAFSVGSRNDIFDLLVSTDSITWITVLDKQIGELGLVVGNYDFIDIEAKYIKYVAQGNIQSNSDWNSIAEIKFNFIKEETPCDCPEIEHDTIYIDRIDTVYLQPIQNIFLKADSSSLYFQLK